MKKAATLKKLVHIGGIAIIVALIALAIVIANAAPNDTHIDVEEVTIPNETVPTLDYPIRSEKVEDTSSTKEETAPIEVEENVEMEEIEDVKEEDVEVEEETATTSQPEEENNTTSNPSNEQKPENKPQETKPETTEQKPTPVVETHTHEWVWVDDVFHYETVVDEQYETTIYTCNSCDFRSSSYTEADDHTWDTGHSCGYTTESYTSTHEELIIDVPGYFKCSCGETKSR